MEQSVTETICEISNGHRHIKRGKEGERVFGTIKNMVTDFLRKNRFSGHFKLVVLTTVPNRGKRQGGIVRLMPGSDEKSLLLTVDPGMNMPGWKVVLYPPAGTSAKLIEGAYQRSLFPLESSSDTESVEMVEEISEAEQQEEGDEESPDDRLDDSAEEEEVEEVHPAYFEDTRSMSELVRDREWTCLAIVAAFPNLEVTPHEEDVLYSIENILGWPKLRAQMALQSMVNHDYLKRLVQGQITSIIIIDEGLRELIARYVPSGSSRAIQQIISTQEPGTTTRKSRLRLEAGALVSGVRTKHLPEEVGKGKRPVGRPKKPDWVPPPPQAPPQPASHSGNNLSAQISSLFQRVEVFKAAQELLRQGEDAHRALLLRSEEARAELQRVDDELKALDAKRKDALAIISDKTYSEASEMAASIEKVLQTYKK